LPQSWDPQGVCQRWAAVIDQALDIATLENERRGLKLANVVVKPELRKFSASDFYSPSYSFIAGYEAAAKSMTDLLPYALPRPVAAAPPRPLRPQAHRAQPSLESRSCGCRAAGKKRTCRRSSENSPASLSTFDVSKPN